MTQSGRLAGKTALVTGAASGIGRAVALEFAAQGAFVYFADRHRDRADAAAAAAPGGRGVSLSVDIADEPSVTGAFDTVIREGGSLDIVVANAGVQLFGEDARVGDLDLEIWRRTIDINLTGTFLTIKHAVRVLPPGSSIIVTGSPTGLTGEGAGFSAYSASKAGIHGLVRTAAMDYAAKGIRINTVVPGFTATPLVSTIVENPDVSSQVLSRVPLGRSGHTDDVTGIMVYLASDESTFATGSMFIIDGGMSTL